MPNIATVLKLEVARVARKELRGQTEGLKKTVNTLRSEISALKRRVQGLEQALKKAARAPARQAPADADTADEKGLRFTAKGLASNRRRLALSAEDFGLLVGASGQSVYAWESGKTQPRAGHLPAIAALRGAGKKEVAARLASLRQQ